MIPHFFHAQSELARQVIELSKKFPNDMDFGKEVRKAVVESQTPKPNPHFELDRPTKSTIQDWGPVAGSDSERKG